MQDKMKAGADFGGIVERAAKGQALFNITHHYEIECRDKNGALKWVEHIDNLVTDVGLNEILDKFWNGNLYVASHYVGLTDGTPTVVAGDTMSSHGGWAEVVAYTESVRQTLNMGSVASQSVDNSANKAVFSINVNSTIIGGAFIATDNTRGGTAGILISEGAFAGGDKTVDDGETLSITVTSTLASA